MSTGGYKIRDQSLPHFLTFATVGWVDVFTHTHYADIVLDSLRYIQTARGLALYGWCLMPNHLPLMIKARNNDLSDLLRDFKKFTAKQILTAIAANAQESRREWMLRMFRDMGEANARNTTNQFSRQDNQPKELFSPAFMVQKLQYMHHNPVAAGLVCRPEHYRLSSTVDYLTDGKGLLDIERI